MLPKLRQQVILFLYMQDYLIKEIVGVGVGGPGAFDKNRRVLKTCVNIPPLQNEPIIEYIEQRLNIPAFGDNDATCAAVGEHIFGAGKDFKNFIMLTIGTGVGGGIVLNDKVYRGRDGFAGELGHVVAVPGGHLCGCGNRGCIEAYASATAIINEVRNGITRGSITSYEGIDPETINAQIIFDKAKAGDTVKITAKVKGTGKISLGVYSYSKSGFVPAPTPHKTFDVSSELKDIVYEFELLESKTKDKDGNLKTVATIRPTFTIVANSDFIIEDIIVEVTNK